MCFFKACVATFGGSPSFSASFSLSYRSAAVAASLGLIAFKLTNCSLFYRTTIKSTSRRELCSCAFYANIITTFKPALMGQSLDHADG